MQVFTKQTTLEAFQYKGLDSSDAVEFEAWVSRMMILCVRQDGDDVLCLHQVGHAIPFGVIRKGDWIVQIAAGFHTYSTEMFEKLYTTCDPAGRMKGKPRRNKR